MAEYVSKELGVDTGYLSDWYISSVGEEPPVWTDEHIEELVNDFIVIPKDAPTADVQPVVETENLSYTAFCDRFICKNCGIYLQDWVKVKVEEYEDGYVDYTHHEYEFKFCPECGAKVKDGDVNG